MPAIVLVGAQWGDEGKGKLVDWLSARADVVVRFQGLSSCERREEDACDRADRRAVG